MVVFFLFGWKFFLFLHIRKNLARKIYTRKIMIKRSFVFITFLLSAIIACCAGNMPHIRHFSESDGLPQSMVTCVMQDSKGYIWISSWNGLTHYDGYTFTHYKARQGDNCPLPSNRITFIRETADGNILCKCPDGFFLFNEKEKRFIALPKKKTDKGDRYRATLADSIAILSLPEYRNVETRILFKDNQDGYWVYTHHGLDRIWFGPGKIKTQKTAVEGEEAVRAAFVDGTRIFIGDKNGFLRITDLNGNTKGYICSDGAVTTKRTAFGANAYCIMKDSKGFLWIGTKPNGLFRLKETKKSGFTVKLFLPDPNNKWAINSNSIYSIIEDSRGRILVGTFKGGLNIIENAQTDSPKFINPDNILDNYPAEARQIHDIKEVNNNVLLIATNKGLYSCSLKSEPRKAVFYCNKRAPSDKESLSNDMVMAILQTSSGEIFVGTYGGGINAVSSKNLLSSDIRFKAFTTDNGMASDIVLNLCEDRTGSIWIVSERSLIQYAPKTKLFTNYSEGVFENNFSFSEMHPAFIAGSNTLLLGTTQGLLPIHISDISKSNFVPQIRFNAPTNIELTPDERNLSISFCALDYNINEKIQYAYMLEGLDNKWLYTSENRINISNIPAGTFRLHVRSTNGDGVWVNNEQTVTIHRTPYFNERPMAWMLYGALALIIVFFAVKVALYIRKLKRELKNLRLSSNERMEYLKVRIGDIIGGNDNRERTENDGFIEQSIFRKKAKEFVQNNLSNPDLNISVFAREMGVSRSVLYIQMKKEFDCTPNIYIVNRRMELASELLKADNGLNISEIAYRCGFSDPKYFSRCFKKATGYTPSDIREAKE